MHIKSIKNYVGAKQMKCAFKNDLKQSRVGAGLVLASFSPLRLGEGCSSPVVPMENAPL